MDSNLFSILNRLRSNLKSNRRFSETLFGNAFTIRSFYTGRFAKSNLYSKISPLGSPTISMVPELEKWVENGRKVRVVELQRIVRDLRKRRRYTHALEVSEWMGNKGIGTLSPSDHAVRLDLIGRVRGLESAESYFNNMSGEDKTYKTYGALLNCYVRARLTDKSMSHMQKMKEMGFVSSPLSYNDLMCLYTNIGEYEKVPGLLTEMKNSGVSPDNFSYRICINSYGARADIDGVENVLEEMENQSHILVDWSTYSMVGNFYIKAGLKEKAVEMLKKSEQKLDEEKDELGYNHLISLYASLGNKAELTRLWELKKAVFKKYINKDYITMLGSLVKLGDLEEAEKLLNEWEKSATTYDFRVPNVLLIGYTQKGLVEKAEAMLESLVDKGKTPTPNSWGIVAAGYAYKDEMKKAVECMKRAFSSLMGNEGWRPNPKVTESILRWLGDNGEAEVVEAFVGSLKTVIPMNRGMYHALIKTSVRGGKAVEGLLENMKADKIDGDEETREILSLREEEAK